jgi:antitoxin HicB
MNSKGIEYYLALPYKIAIHPEPDGSGYTALIPQLPGCITSGDSIEELWAMIQEAKQLWLEVALDEGVFIPEPMPEEDERFSGKLLVRMPTSLHRQLAARAQSESTSLNQLVVMLLSDGMGRWQQGFARAREYARVAAEYPRQPARNFAGVYSLLVKSLHAQHEAPVKDPPMWDTSLWQFAQKEDAGVMTDG